MSAEPLSITVLGAGGIGSTLAAALSRAGHEVFVIDTWREHVEAIGADGLEVTGPAGTVRVELAAGLGFERPGPTELVILATKSRDLAAAARAAAECGAIGDRTTVLTFQNGLGSLEPVEVAVRPDRLVRGTVGRFGARVVAPGRVRHEGDGVIGIGPSAARGSLATLFEAAGFAVLRYGSVEQMVWEKLVCNAGFSGACAVHGATIGEVIADPDAWRRACGCAAEAYALGQRLGVELDYRDPVEHLRGFGASIADARPSMLLDLEAGRPTEVDVINGGVAELAARSGLAAPFNAAVAQQVRARERGMAPLPLRG